VADHPGNPDVPASPDVPVTPDVALLDGRWYQRKPFDDYRWLRDNAPAYRDPTCGVWALTRHADVMFASKNPGVFSSAKGSRPETETWTPSMINFDDPEHKRRRNLVNRGFTPRRVADHEPKVRSICAELIERAIERGECDFVRDVAAPLPMIVIGDMLGVRPEDRDMLLRWSDELLLAVGSDDPGLKERQAVAAIEYAVYALDVVRDRRAKPLQDDLMSALVHAKIDGESLDDEEIVQESLLILIGGDETTRHVITEGMEALIRRPDQRRILVDDPSKIPVGVEEMLRWVSPIKNMNRTLTRDVELHGQRLGEGDRVLLLYQSANLDERVFDEPERFDVERKPNDHVAFGGYGAHFCLGASLARLELRIMFEELLGRIGDIELATDEPLPLRPNNFIVGIEEMPVRLTAAR
jgi:cytochrome P450 family 142 subfamily A polypeptide 1